MFLSVNYLFYRADLYADNIVRVGGQLYRRLNTSFCINRNYLVKLTGGNRRPSPQTPMECDVAHTMAAQGTVGRYELYKLNLDVDLAEV